MKFKIMESVVISIEGSIGAGKSTLIQKLKERFNKVTFLTEPLKYYTSFKYHNPLAKFICNSFYRFLCCSRFYY